MKGSTLCVGLVTTVALVSLSTPPRATGQPTDEGESPAASEDEGEDPLARDEWFYGQRAFPRLSIPAGAYLRARRQASKLPRFPFLPEVASATAALQAGSSFAWTPIGPRPIDPPGTLNDAGRVTSLAVQNAQTVYAGAAAGGVWKTTNGGLNWNPVFDRQASLAIGSITIDPNNANTVYVGTGEANFSADSYYGAGLFRSTNGGVTWFKLGGNRFDSCSISDIVVKPGDAKTIGVAVVGSGVQGPTACAASRQGVHVSTDGGLTWALKAPPPGGIFSPFGVTDLAISPAAPAVWFAGTAIGEVWRSTDSGQSWGPTLIVSKGARTSLAISPSNPKLIVAAVEMPATATTTATADLFFSGDAGTNWNSTSLPVPAGLCGGNGQCWYDLALTFDPSNNRVFYLGAISLFRYAFTPGSGWSATQVASAVHVDFHALAHDPAGDLWLGSDGGVYTLRWTPLSQIIVGKSGDLPITEFEPGISGNLSQLIGGTQDNGTLRYSGTLRWDQILGGDGGFSASDPGNSQTIYASQQNFRFSRSTDGGATWTSITPTLPTGDRGLFYSPFTNEPGQPNTLYAGSQRLWRSTDQGSTWTALQQFANRISAIGTGTSTPAAANATAYVGFAAGGAQYSTNITAATPTWTASVGLPNRSLTDFWVNPADPREAYAAVSGFGGGHLFHTTDGVNWANTSGNHPDTPVNAIAVDTTGAFPIIYTGTDVGVFASGDGGLTWANASTNLPPTVVIDLLIDPSQGALIAATHGRGAYTAQLAQAPPFAALTPPTAITDPVVARFNVPVQNITSSNFVLRVQGMSTNLTASFVCEDSTGAPADCAAGPVSVARLQPTSALIPGQRYVAMVNPVGAPSQIADGFGTAVLPTARAFRASLSEEETSPAVDYTWQTVRPGTTPGPLGGSYTQHNLVRASASFPFDGTQITWITVTGPDQGIANVFVDNTLVSTMDNFSPARTYNVRRTFPGLTPGPHVIRIEPTGQSQPAATGTFVAVDGLQIGDKTPIATPAVTYRWQPDSAFDSTIGYVRSDLGPTAQATATRATLTFRGTSVSWRTITGPNEGRARVLIDGVDQGVIDNYSATLAGTSRIYSGLADAVHTITIVVRGTRRPISNGTFISVEGWEVQ
jgi:photosystem II stability/assembly factor-like uncharacterized protein